MADIYNLILEEGYARNTYYIEKYYPFFISSIGCHAFNIMNQKKKIYTEAGEAINTRLHILYVTFPGFGKSFFLKQFLKSPEYSFVNGTKFTTTFEGSQTEAGFVGTAKFDESGKPCISEGLCKEHDKSIIGVEEFSSMTNSFKQDYNSGLDTAMLLALDSGDVVKRLGAGRVGYHTDMTLWAGVQPARYDIGGGFSRRLLFMTFYPSIADITRYRKNRVDAQNVIVSRSKMNALRMAIDNRIEEVNNLKSIHFSNDYRAEISKLDNFHYEDSLYDRLAIGYWIMRKETIRDQLFITMDAELRRIIHLEDQYRRDVNNYSISKVIWNLIKDEEKINNSRLYNICMRLGFEELQINEAMRALYMNKKIKKVDGFIHL